MADFDSRKQAFLHVHPVLHAISTNRWRDVFRLEVPLATRGVRAVRGGRLQHSLAPCVGGFSSLLADWHAGTRNSRLGAMDPVGVFWICFWISICMKISSKVRVTSCLNSMIAFLPVIDMFVLSSVCPRE